MANRDWHQVEYIDTGRTYCGADPEDLLVVPDDQLDPTEGVTCETCLEAMEEEHIAELEEDFFDDEEEDDDADMRKWKFEETE